MSCQLDGPVWVDADGDGFGGERADPCASDAVAQGGDCDDFDAERHPGAREQCNGLDDDCDGALDPRERDEDGDRSLACRDCDDHDAARFPGAADVCNGIDDNCDGVVDEDSAHAPPWYPDQDGDGHGDASGKLNTCDPPPGYVDNDTDCDDGEPRSWPGNREQCDEIDRDCDGAAWPRFVVSTSEALSTAITEARSGETICLEAGTFDTELFIDRPVHLEGAGADKSILRPAVRTAPALTWLHKGDVHSPSGSIRGVGLHAGEAGAWVLQASGEAAPDLLDVHVQTHDAEPLKLSVEGMAEWSDLTVTGSSTSSPWRIEAPRVSLRDVHMHALAWTWSADPALHVDSAQGVRVHDVRIDSSDTPDPKASALIEATTLRDVTVQGLHLDLPTPNRGLTIRSQQRGLLLTAVEAEAIQIDGVRGTIGDVRGALLHARLLDDVIIEDVDLSGRYLLGLIAPNLARDRDQRWRDIRLQAVRLDIDEHLGGLFSTYPTNWLALDLERVQILDAQLRAGRVHGGLINAQQSAPLTVRQLDVRGVSIRAEDEIRGAIFEAVRPVPSAHNTVLGSLRVEAPVASLFRSRGVALSFATWRDVHVHSSAPAFDGLAHTCSVDHADLSRSSLPSAPGCTVIWSNLAEVEGFTAEGASTHEPGHVDTAGDDPLAWDLHLSSSSPLIDAGDPTVVDADGSRADISGYGGLSP